MPNPGQANNPSGVNSFEGFGQEPAYGEITQTQRLAGASPLAGGKIAAGAINAPRNAQRATQQPAPSATPVPEGTVDMVPGLPSLDVASVWQQIAAMPGAEQYPILQQMAARA